MTRVGSHRLLFPPLAIGATSIGLTAGLVFAIDEWTASIAQELRRNPADSASSWSARQASRAEEGGSEAA